MDARQLKNTRRRLVGIIEKGELMQSCHTSAAIELLTVKDTYHPNAPCQWQLENYCRLHGGLDILDFLRERNARVAGFSGYSREVIQRGMSASEELAQLGVVA